MRMLDRMPQWNLHDAGPQFDARGLGCQSTEEDQWIERWLAAGKGVSNPQSVKTQRLDLAGDAGHMFNDVWSDVRGGRDGDDAESHCDVSLIGIVAQGVISTPDAIKILLSTEPRR